MKRESRYFQKVVVITGGSSGIGLAVAKEFAKQKAQPVIIGRDPEKLNTAAKQIEEIAGTPSSVMCLAADVSEKNQIAAAIDSAGEKFGRIDVLINNAGITGCGRFARQPPEQLEECLFTNYLGAVYASKAAWPWLKKSGGQLSFVSSVAGYLGLIGYSAYAPTKFALTGLAECLRMEGKDDGIRVSIIYPPDTDTPMLEYERKHGLPETLALSSHIKLKSADAVAVKYIRGLQKNKFEIYCDFNSRLLRWLKNNFPGLFHAVTDRIISRVRRSRDKVL
jgi:3-dehydrosphinganine reductase